MRPHIAALSAALLLFAAGLSLAQNRRGGPNFSRAEPITVQGAVDNVRHIVRRNMSGTQITLKSDDQIFTVLVGPAAFLQQENLTLAKGDQLDIAAWKIKTGDATFFVARQVTKDGKTYTLRDQQGNPRWSRSHTRTGGD